MERIQKNYTYNYIGKQNYIDINTLLTSQFHFSFILSEIQKELYPDVELKIKIQAFEGGSFDVNHIIELAQVGLFFLSGNIDYIWTMFSVLADYLAIKKY
jgi:hypothetical protein